MKPGKDGTQEGKKNYDLKWVVFVLYSYFHSIPVAIFCPADNTFCFSEGKTQKILHCILESIFAFWKMSLPNL